MIVYRHVAVPPVSAPVQECLLLLVPHIPSDFAHMELRPFSVEGSGSGANFFSLSTHGQAKYIVKMASQGSPRKRVQEEMHAYEVLGKKSWDLPYLKPHIIENSGVSCLVLPFLDGECTSDLVRKQGADAGYGLVFDQGIGRLLKQYRDTCHVCEDPLAWFRKQTLGKALDPLATYPLFTGLNETNLVLNNVDLPNGLTFFRALAANSPDGLAALSSSFHDAVQWILSPRYVAEVPTDPNTLNEMVVSRDQGPEVYWIDPGRVENAQLVYPLIKHEGMFAHVLPYMLKAELGVSSDGAGRYQISLKDRELLSPGFQCSRKLQSLSSVMQRLRAHPDGRALLENRPFFTVHFLFFAFRQFLRDMPYGMANQDPTRVQVDFCFFSLGMRVIQPILKEIVCKVSLAFPNVDVAEVMRNPQNGPFLRGVTENAYGHKMSEKSPEMDLYREWFGV